MNITVDNHIRRAAPDLALGIVSAQVQVRGSDGDLREVLEALAERKNKELAALFDNPRRSTARLQF